MTKIGDASSAEFDRYSADIYGWAYRILGRHHDALDIVQDVFLRWDSARGRCEPAHTRGWLRRVTVNRSIDLYRSKRHDVQSLAGSAESMVTDQGLIPAVDKARLRTDVATALESLTDVQRAVLVAKVYDSMTFVKIAEEVALSVSTVKTHYLRAVRAVRDRLEPRWALEVSR